ncbi:MAG: bifunctional riboflavin kinase/FAD synthetase [Acidobacteriota bacterium]|nr:bifunctional riboflavin kinase/FAD synthetase [Acidobacteriota bacterium]
MRVFRGLEEVPEDFGPCALTVGNFDGVHAGHREILRRVVEVAREQRWRSAAMTFDPHPARVVAPERAPRLMTAPEQRIAAMAADGIEEVLVLPFDATVALWSPDFFVREVLVRKLKARAVLVGEDFRFGHKHAGNAALLRVLGAELGFVTEFVPPVIRRGARVSSSRIREMVETGHVGPACRLLTRPFALQGLVVSGHGIGNRQTVPTLNLKPEFEILPARGVYVTRTRDVESGAEWRSVTNVGMRPTFDGDALTIETFVLGELRETPREIRVEFLARVRAERKFSSAEALKEQILRDVRSAERYFGACNNRNEL